MGGRGTSRPPGTAVPRDSPLDLARLWHGERLIFLNTASLIGTALLSDARPLSRGGAVVGCRRLSSSSTPARPRDGPGGGVAALLDANWARRSLRSVGHVSQSLRARWWSGLVAVVAVLPCCTATMMTATSGVRSGPDVIAAPCAHGRRIWLSAATAVRSPTTTSVLPPTPQRSECGGSRDRHNMTSSASCTTTSGPFSPGQVRLAAAPGAQLPVPRKRPAERRWRLRREVSSGGRTDQQRDSTALPPRAAL